MVRLGGLVVLMVCFGVSYGCVTPENKAALDLMAQGIIDQVVNNNLATLNAQDQLEFAPENLPDILAALCSPSGKPVLTQIETQLGNCQALALEDTKLNSLTINGVGFTQLVTVFQSVDHFCQCSSNLPNAWALQADQTTKVYQEPTAAYTDIAHVGNICGESLKTLLTSVGGAESDCKDALKTQTGVAKFDGYYDIAKDCSANTEADWTCMKGVATSSTFKECITEANNKVGDEALCGKYECVAKKMSGCTMSARSLYIKAVIVENPSEIRENDVGCSACSLQISLLMLAICLFLLNL